MLLRCSFAVMATLTLCTGAPAAESKLKGLLITGGCCHDYPVQKRLIAEGVSQRASISWHVVHEGGTSRDHKVAVYGRPGWARQYDVVVHNECFGAVDDPEFVAEIVAAHRAGVPAVFIHCSLHSYRAAGAGVEPWRELIGVTSTSHEKHRPVLVRNVNREHPVMQGFPAEWRTPNGELYKIEKMWPNCVPLAVAYGKDTRRDHTCIWVNKLGPVRVFGTSLGHHNETMNTEEWLGLVSRGVLWACGKLSDEGQPLPGYEGTGVKPIQLAPLEPVPEP